MFIIHNNFHYCDAIVLRLQKIGTTDFHEENKCIGGDTLHSIQGDVYCEDQIELDIKPIVDELEVSEQVQPVSKFMGYIFLQINIPLKFKV